MINFGKIIHKITMQNIVSKHKECVCMYMYVCVFVYACVLVCGVCVCGCMHVCMCVRVCGVCVCLHARVGCVYACECAYTCIYMCVCVHDCVCMCVHLYVCVCVPSILLGERTVSPMIVIILSWLISKAINTII